MNRDVFQDSQVKKSCPQCMFKPLFELATTCTEKLKKNRPTMIQVICLFVYFVALSPKSTAMVMAGRSVRLTTLLGRLEQAVNQ